MAFGDQDVELDVDLRCNREISNQSVSRSASSMFASAPPLGLLGHLLRRPG